MKNKTAPRLGLVLDFNAITALDEHGINVLDKKHMDKIELTPSVVRKFVHAGLLHKNPNLSLEAAGKLVTMSNLGHVINEIQAAITKGFTGS